MEISTMVSQLKTEEESISRTLETKNAEANALRFQLGILEAEIRKLKDRYDAMKNASEYLELVKDDGDPVVVDERPIPEFIKRRQMEDKPAVNVVAKTHSRKAKRIGKFDPNGKKIAEYSSINKAAKEFGWNNVAMSEYIKNTAKEKQIRLRGYYLEFLAA